MRRGSSGAKFYFAAAKVTKHSGGPRVHSQGMWLLQHPSPIVPSVYNVTDLAYSMERLVSAPLQYLDHLQVLHAMISGLNTHVWSQPAVVSLDIDALELKIIMITHKFNLLDVRTKLLHLLSNIKWDDLPTCLTHGDPTFDNVMFREATGEVVLIDPIPAAAAVPDIRAVDLGKILQSLLGWEAVRYADQTQQVWPHVLFDFMIDLKVNERKAVVFWAIVHIIRTYPYTSDDIRSGQQEMIDHAFSLI
jgi:hypothetical protein